MVATQILSGDKGLQRQKESLIMNNFLKTMGKAAALV
jgi:hypothetical protein